MDGNIKINNTNLKFLPVEFYQKAKQGKLQNFDILICKDGALTGKTALFQTASFNFTQAMINEHVFLLRTNEQCQQRYLFNILISEGGQKILKSNISGQAQGGLNRTNLLNIKIPLPPRDIQEKIVNETEVLEGKETEIKKQILNQKNQINLQFSQGTRNTAIKFSEVATLEYGKALPKHKRITGKYMVMGSNGSDGTHNEYLINGPCIIVGRKGSAGKISYIEENCYPIDTTFYVQVNGKIYLKYLYFIMKKLELESLVKGKGLGVPGLNRHLVHELKISIHPIEQQQKIVTQIEAIEKEISDLQTELDKIPYQKQHILKKYL